jgi:signal transduction histidine kinase
MLKIKQLEHDPHELVEQLKSNFFLSVSSNFIVALITVWLLSDTVPQNILLVWLVTHILLAMLRLITARRLNPDELSNKVWQSRKLAYILAMTAIGLHWGMTSILAVIYSPPIIQTIMAFLLTGLTAGAISTLTPIFSGFLAYFFGTLTPLFFATAMSSSDELTSITPIIVLYVAIVYSAAKKMHVSLVNSLELTQELQQVNEQLIDQKELAEQANKSKSVFLSSMSHELRTPLNAVIGFSEILKFESITPTQKIYIDHIEGAGKHLLTLIEEVLDLSTVEAGNIKLEPKLMSLKQVISSSIGMIEPIAEKRNITVTLGADSCDSIVYADPKRVQQVLLNLLSNAIKYNKDDGTIDIHCEQIDSNEIKVSVKDTGLGIHSDKHTHVFTAFDRLGNEAGNIEGTGIGLFFSKQLIERMNGQVGFESEHDVGSTFWFTLNLSKV